jgi:hypothetical protein
MHEQLDDLMKFQNRNFINAKSSFYKCPPCHKAAAAVAVCDIPSTASYNFTFNNIQFINDIDCKKLRSI